MSYNVTVLGNNFAKNYISLVLILCMEAQNSQRKKKYNKIYCCFFFFLVCLVSYWLLCVY